MKNDTHRHFYCQNECDEPVPIVDPLTKCPDFVCKRRNLTKPYPQPVRISVTHTKKHFNIDSTVWLLNIRTPRKRHHKLSSWPQSCHRSLNGTNLELVTQFILVQDLSKVDFFLGVHIYMNNLYYLYWWKIIFFNQVCDDKCHELETKTDKCGYNYEVCKCRKPPGCTPPKPKEIQCHTIKKVEKKALWSSQVMKTVKNWQAKYWKQSLKI